VESASVFGANCQVLAIQKNNVNLHPLPVVKRQHSQCYYASNFSLSLIYWWISGLGI